MRKMLICLSLVATFAVACAGGDPDRCAFESRDGTCAVVASTTGALECKLDDEALCKTVTEYIANGKGAVASTSSALINTGASPGELNRLRPPSLVCEPDGTFMCTCCSVSSGCYPCPKKLY